MVPLKALSIAFGAVILLVVYSILGIHNPTAGDIFIGIPYFLVICLFSLPIAALLAWALGWFKHASYKRRFSLSYAALLYLESIVVVLSLVVESFSSNDFDTIFNDSVRYEIVDEDLDPNDAEILINRLAHTLPSRYSRVRLDLNQGVIEFHRGAPNRETVEFLASRRGVLGFYRSNSQISFVSNSDLVNAKHSHGYDGKSKLTLTLDFEGGSKMLRNTQGYENGELIFKIDDEVVSSAKVNTALGASILIDLMDDRDPSLYAILLNYGVLSNGIKLHFSGA